MWPILDKLFFAAWLCIASLLSHLTSKWGPEEDNLQVQQANFSERHKLALAETHCSEQTTQTLTPALLRRPTSESESQNRRCVEFYGNHIPMF